MDRRQVAEVLLARGPAAVDPEAAIAAVDSDKERIALLDEMKEIQRGGALLADLEKKLPEISGGAERKNSAASASIKTSWVARRACRKAGAVLAYRFPSRYPARTTPQRCVSPNESLTIR